MFRLVSSLFYPSLILNKIYDKSVCTVQSKSKVKVETKFENRFHFNLCFDTKCIYFNRSKYQDF